jgi:hypothetical protein
MRKVLSIGVLAAASLSVVWQPAIAEQQTSVTPVVYSRHGGYYYRGRFYPRRMWVRGYWRRGRYYPGHYRYYRR